MLCRVAAWACSDPLPFDLMDPSTIETFEFFMSASHIKLTCPPGKVMNGTRVEIQILECGAHGWTKPEWCVNEKELGPAGDPQAVIKYCMFALPLLSSFLLIFFFSFFFHILFYFFFHFHSHPLSQKRPTTYYCMWWGAVQRGW